MAVFVVGSAIVKYVVSVSRRRGQGVSARAFGLMRDIHSCVVRWVVPVHRSDLGEASKYFGFFLELGENSPGFGSWWVKGIRLSESACERGFFD